MPRSGVIRCQPVPIITVSYLRDVMRVTGHTVWYRLVPDIWASKCGPSQREEVYINDNDLFVWFRCFLIIFSSRLHKSMHCHSYSRSRTEQEESNAHPDCQLQLERHDRCRV